MPTMIVEVKDGAMPLDSCLRCLIKCESPALVLPETVVVTGAYVKFQFGTTLVAKNPWNVTVGSPGAKTTRYAFPDLSRPKKVTHALVKAAPAPAAPAAMMAAPPPAQQRLLATYQEEGVGVPGVTWHAGVESGTTDSLGQVMVSATGPLLLAVAGDEIDSIDDGETVTINVTTETSGTAQGATGG